MMLSSKKPSTTEPTTLKSIQHADDLKNLLGETGDKKAPVPTKPTQTVTDPEPLSPQETEKKADSAIIENKSGNVTALESTENEVCVN